MHPIKYVWALRALLYKPFFKHIGKMSYIGKPCFIEGCKGISIGNKTRIFPGLRVEAIDDGEIVIGNNCAVEQNFHAISRGSVLEIENDVTISGGVFVSNTDHDYTNINISVMDQDLINKKTRIGRGSFIGYGAVILPGTQLGQHCVVGANSVVRGVFPDNCVIAGCPAVVVKIYNKDSEEWEKITKEVKQSG